MTTEKSIKIFKWVVAVIAIIPLFTGVGDMLNGVASQLMFGMVDSIAVTDPLLNSSFRFFAALWFGVGVFFLLFISNLKKYYTALMVLFALVILGGITRVITIIQFGFPEANIGIAMVIFATTIEIVIIPLLTVWLWRLRLTI